MKRIESGMCPSAWKIWLHPRRTRREVSELTAELEQLKDVSVILGRAEGELESTQRELDATRNELQSLRQDHNLLRDNICRLENEKTRLEERVSELERDLRNANQELAGRIEADTQIKKFEAKLGGIEKLKTQYEQRIRRLRDEIKSLRSYSGMANPEADELREIDMVTGRPKDVTARKQTSAARRSQKPAADDSDWLQELPS